MLSTTGWAWGEYIIPRSGGGWEVLGVGKGWWVCWLTCSSNPHSFLGFWKIVDFKSCSSSNSIFSFLCCCLMKSLISVKNSCPITTLSLSSRGVLAVPVLGLTTRSVSSSWILPAWWNMLEPQIQKDASWQSKRTNYMNRDRKMGDRTIERQIEWYNDRAIDRVTVRMTDRTLEQQLER